MFNTVLLKDQDDVSKTFSRMNTADMSSKVFSNSTKRFITEKIKPFTNRVNLFSFSNGSVELQYLNTLYCLEHMPHATDVILPKNPRITDFVVLFYEQTTIVFDISIEKKTRITIRGNGQRIMGLDENLVCDMNFMSIRLVYGGPIDGWVVC